MMKNLKKYRDHTGFLQADSVKQVGFTLLELMIVLGIASILMVAATPSIIGALNNNAQISAVNVFNSGIAAAKANALTRKRPVFIQSKTEDGDWSMGFFIILGAIDNDPEIDTNFESDNQITITEISGDEFLSFDHLGRATPASSTFEVCNQDTGRAVMIDVNIYGNTTVRKNGENFDYADC